MSKVDNRPNATAAKIDLRARVLAGLPAVHVFEGFCGLVGASMWAAWEGAASHEGCDARYSWPDPRQRWVGDTHRLLTVIDLSRYNTFDFDAYGEPWRAMVVLAARRRWKPGERGAVVLTDGAGRRTKFGSVPAGMRNLLGVTRCAPKDRHERMHRDCLSIWARRAGVTIDSVWLARSPLPQPMIYSAAIFTGNGTVPEQG